IHMSDEVKKAHDELRSFMFANVYKNSVAKAEEAKAKALVEKLYLYFLRNPEKMPEEYKKIMQKFDKERAVCDYIAGMTDVYAVNLYNELFIPKGWKI
ncbi:MAG: deoxyguanosinetriphosphate triphosphohydrolase, partial [Oscillospiraceae bacterium]